MLFNSSSNQASLVLNPVLHLPSTLPIHSRRRNDPPPPPLPFWAALAPLTLAASASITYPATIETDLLFPLNATYDSNPTSPPIIVGIQNGQAAYAYEWSIR
ncbi:hypothetical protein VC83_09178 [Pseudogymnoascus destructans]|uniref:DUF7136 domain-containing protein n=2 Tax=Pseudogymnoascus destructans TaxID=655981 RepID=L8FW42_PSED2|nr:uncharacterized protein VC83_09178 [Pseudogymnoascus destructans]ELR04759.1 hypothetical protein GMDG_06987 [Pseudogymnoascus destructans 20631-21]OAF54543.1 hypothetical protein VC83_09178 [Pseudogymnoascus destructans]